MLFTKKISLAVLTLCVTLPTLTMAKTTKRAEDVFKKWIDIQEIMPDKNLATMADQLNDDFLASFKNQYEQSAPLLTSLTPLLDSITASHINSHGYFLKAPMNDMLTSSLSNLYQLLQNDMPGFINLVKDSNFLANQTSRSQDSESFAHAIEKYHALLNLLFAHPNQVTRNHYLFAVANQFYEYCFNPKTFNDFCKLHQNKNIYPITRLLYATTWFNLAGNGWKTWHEDCLKALRQSAQQGKQVVYIAGGSDIYQLIKAGVYDIKNIDPQLPSQPHYYTQDWQFILHGDIGDTILFTFENRMIIMERTNFEVPGSTFKVRIATGEVLEIPHSRTTWTISDLGGNTLGQYVLERRLCHQSDFSNEPNKTILISFNELYFICAPTIISGWNIEPSQFDQNLSIVVKQLRNPITKQMAVNMRIASLLNTTDFKFIALGSCIN